MKCKFKLGLVGVTSMKATSGRYTHKYARVPTHIKDTVINSWGSIITNAFAHSIFTHTTDLHNIYDNFLITDHGLYIDFTRLSLLSGMYSSMYSIPGKCICFLSHVTHNISLLHKAKPVDLIWNDYLNIYEQLQEIFRWHDNGCVERNHVAFVQVEIQVGGQTLREIRYSNTW